MTDGDGFADPHSEPTFEQPNQPPAPPPQHQWTAPLPAQPAPTAPESPWSAPTQPAADWGAPTQPVADWGAPPPPPPAVPGAPPAAAPPAWGAPPPVWGAPPPPPRRRRRAVVLVVVACLVLAGLGAGAWIMFGPSSSQKFTFQGASIARPADVLSAAEKSVKSVVAARHGAMANDTRCYFAKPTKPAAGASKDEVDPALRCGPVLFVDGDTAKTYLPFTLTTTSKAANKVSLRANDNPDTDTPQAIPSSLTLARPDGKKPPRTGTLAVPAPPPAEKRALVSTDLGKVTPPKQLDNAEMISLNTGVRVVAAGVVPRYGSGDAARVAAPGEQLIAFQIEDEPGEAADNSPASDLSLVDSQGSRELPDGSGVDYIVAGEPAGTTVKLELRDGGYIQTLEVPSGKPGANNLTVLSRDNRFDSVTKKVDVPATLSAGGDSESTTFHATIDGARLFFWLPHQPTVHPAHPGNALLLVNIDYTDPLNPGQSYAFDPQLLAVRLPNGQLAHARNVSTEADKILDVIEVPGDFTTGTLVIGGSVTRDGFTISVSNSVTVPLEFHAG